jgi:hypothetical protein
MIKLVCEKSAQTYQMMANMNQNLITLPNPERTDTRVEQNFLYAVADAQVPQEHEVEEEHIEGEDMNEE